MLLLPRARVARHKLLPAMVRVLYEGNMGPKISIHFLYFCLPLLTEGRNLRGELPAAVSRGQFFTPKNLISPGTPLLTFRY